MISLWAEKQIIEGLTLAIRLFNAEKAKQEGVPVSDLGVNDEFDLKQGICALANRVRVTENKMIEVIPTLANLKDEVKEEKEKREFQARAFDKCLKDLRVKVSTLQKNLAKFIVGSQTIK